MTADRIHHHVTPEPLNGGDRPDGRIEVDSRGQKAKSTPTSVDDFLTERSPSDEGPVHFVPKRP